MKKYKALWAALAAAAAVGLCSVCAHAEETGFPADAPALTELTTALTSEPDVTVAASVSTTTVSEAEAVSEKTGWSEQEGKKYYLDDNGEKLTGYQKIDGKEYYFAANGAVKSGFYTVKGVRMYFSPETFERQFGWVENGGLMYYLDENGKTVGRRSVDDKDYIFDEHGICMHGWFEFEGSKYYSDMDNGLYSGKAVIDNELYYFSGKGKFRSGWVDADGKRVFYDYDTARPMYGWINYNSSIYYCSEEKGKLTGDSTVEGLMYRFTDNGCLLTGMLRFSDGTRYYTEDGKIQRGIVSVNGKKYYFDEKTCLMQTGMQTAGDTTYCFGKDGVMLTGWQEIGGKKYNFGKDGAMLIGWQKIDGDKYYFDKNGAMLTGSQTIDGKKYYFYENGVLENGRWDTVKGEKYYYGSDGKMYKNGVFNIKNEYYCFAKNGVMLTGWQKIKGDYYLFDRLDGKRQANCTVDGIKIKKDGKAAVNDWSLEKIKTMMTAHKFMLEQTKPTDSMEEKRLKVFNWILTFPYRRFRLLNQMYEQQGWEMTFANDIFERKMGCCVSTASAVAFLFREIGYTDVYVCHDTGHSWAAIGDRLFDPVFAKGKDFNSNYNAIPSDYRINPYGKRAIG